MIGRDTFHQVERVSSRGTALYLAHDFDLMERFWSAEAEKALTYDDLEDAQADADQFGGEVSSFGRPSHIADAFSAPVIQLVAAE